MEVSFARKITDQMVYFPLPYLMRPEGSHDLVALLRDWTGIYGFKIVFLVSIVFELLKYVGTNDSLGKYGGLFVAFHKGEVLIPLIKFCGDLQLNCEFGGLESTSNEELTSGGPKR